MYFTKSWFLKKNILFWLTNVFLGWESNVIGFDQTIVMPSLCLAQCDPKAKKRWTLHTKSEDFKAFSLFENKCILLHFYKTLWELSRNIDFLCRLGSLQNISPRRRFSKTTGYCFYTVQYCVNLAVIPNSDYQSNIPLL